MKLIESLQEILDNEGLRYQIIKDELAEIKLKFGDERRTEITYLDDEIGMLDLIEEEEVSSSSGLKLRKRRRRRMLKNILAAGF